MVQKIIVSLQPDLNYKYGYKDTKKMSEVKRINKVKIKRGTSRELARLFKVSTVTVSLAVNGVNNSELAQKIRKAAVEMGGDAIYSSNK
ncbi:MAG: hypothetical protein LBG80_19980 [Bacteroidales bacterium]|jgi:hypothetical protein|nr:hypothetical protein [Bacteroidales bacterium]